MKKTLLIYTGGTIGSVQSQHGLTAEGFFWERVCQQAPTLKKHTSKIEIEEYKKPLDSAELTPRHWVELAKRMVSAKNQYQAFIIIQGTDTLTYTTAALSYLLENFPHPVIITGAMIPLGMKNSDAVANLTSAFKATRRKAGVYLAFSKQVKLGINIEKLTTQNSDAFYEPLSLTSKVKKSLLNLNLKPNQIRKFDLTLDSFVVYLPLVPTLNPETIIGLAEKNQALILGLYGNGTAPTQTLLKAIQFACRQCVLVGVISQVPYGIIKPSLYQSGHQLFQQGVIPIRYHSLSSAIAKIHLMLSLGYQAKKIQEKIF